MPQDPNDVTRFLSAAADGDKAATDALLPLVYEQLRKVAQRRLEGERSGHTIASLRDAAALELLPEARARFCGPR